MKKFYYLKTCDTCNRILKELQLPKDVNLHEIKENTLTAQDLNEMHALAGSYESLFSKRARLYKERDLKNKNLKEEDYKNLIIEHYTFLKRPVLICDNVIFIGNSKKTVEEAKKYIHE